MAPPAPKTVEELGPLVGRLLRQHVAERPRLDNIAAWAAGRRNDIYSPRKVTAEYRALVQQSRFNVLPLVEDTVAQALYIDGYRPTGPSGRAPDRTNTEIWESVWQPNRMDARQAQLWRPAIRYGYAYALVWPANPAPKITPFSPRRMTAIYEDPVHDEWPEAAISITGRLGTSVDVNYYADPVTAGPSVPELTKITIYDKHYRYRMAKSPGRWDLVGDAELHDLGEVPVVRFTNQVPSDDHDLIPCTGKIEPLLPAQRQLNQISFSLAMALQYAAFRQRYVTGMAIQQDANGNDIEPFNSAVDRLFHAESPDTKFGEFGQTDVGGYLKARTEVLLYITSIAQIPPHNMVTGPGISNLSADALVALEASHGHDVEEHQSSFGESTEQMLRLAGLARGDQEAWNDMSAQVSWRDTTPRSMAQTADALGKLATMLDVPVEALWEFIPDVTQQDLATWKEMRGKEDLVRHFREMVTGPGGPAPELEGAPVGVGSNGAA